MEMLPLPYFANKLLVTGKVYHFLKSINKLVKFSARPSTCWTNSLLLINNSLPFWSFQTFLRSYYIYIIIYILLYIYGNQP